MHERALVESSCHMHTGLTNRNIRQKIQAENTNHSALCNRQRLMFRPVLCNIKSDWFNERVHCFTDLSCSLL